MTLTSPPALAQSYQDKSQYHLALPLFFQALRLCQEPCHIAVLSKPSLLQLLCPVSQD
jgi:hypothetical protein